MGQIHALGCISPVGTRFLMSATALRVIRHG
jgi:hypothetical protein